MKIELELPDWAMKGQIRILSNLELVGYKQPGEKQPWFIKSVRCNFCGECCLSVGNAAPFGVNDEGACLKLRKNAGKWECTAGVLFPAMCQMPPKNAPNCIIAFEKQNG